MNQGFCRLQPLIGVVNEELKNKANRPLRSFGARQIACQMLFCPFTPFSPSHDATPSTQQELCMYVIITNPLRYPFSLSCYSARSGLSAAAGAVVCRRGATYIIITAVGPAAGAAGNLVQRISAFLLPGQPQQPYGRHGRNAEVVSATCTENAFRLHHEHHPRCRDELSVPISTWG